MQNNYDLTHFITQGMRARPLAVELEHYKSIKDEGDIPIPALENLSADESDAVLWSAYRNSKSIDYGRGNPIYRENIILYHLSLKRKNLGELWLDSGKIHSLSDEMLELNNGVYTPEIVSLKCYVEGNRGMFLWDAVEGKEAHNIGECLIAIENGTAWINKLYPPDRCFTNLLHGVCLMHGWGMERDLYKAFFLLHCIYDGWWQKKAREYLNDLRFMLPHRPVNF